MSDEIPTNHELPTATVTVVCRHDLGDFLKMNARFTTPEATAHYPFIVIQPFGGEVVVRTLRKLPDVLALDNSTLLMVQWPGKHRSDFFRMTVGDLRNHLSGVTNQGYAESSVGQGSDDDSAF